MVKPSVSKPRVSLLYSLVLPLTVALFITSNIVAQKFFDWEFLGIFWSLDVGTLLLFPMIYLLGDVLVEVWGYGAARRVIWTSFAMQALAAILFTLAVAMPSSPYFDAPDAFARILGAVPALVIASLLGYLGGSFSNSYVMAKMKEWMVKWDPNHKWLPLRTISSTIVGEFVDTVIFIGVGSIAGIFPGEIFIMLTLTSWIVKTLIEAGMTPFTIIIIKYLKKREGEDAVGIPEGDTYNPLSMLFGWKKK